MTEESRSWCFRVYARPVSQGSMRERLVTRRKPGQRTRFIVHDMGARLHVWREAVAASARLAGVRLPRTDPATTPFSVSITFYVERRDGFVCAWPTYKHDLDKLTRAVLDALTGIAWADDGQVVRFRNVAKEWASAACPVGAMIQVEQLPG